MTWVLLLAVMKGGSGIALSSTTGFKSKEACEQAGRTATATFEAFNAGRSAQFSCVSQ